MTLFVIGLAWAIGTALGLLIVCSCGAVAKDADRRAGIDPYS